MFLDASHAASLAAFLYGCQNVTSYAYCLKCAFDIIEHDFSDQNDLNACLNENGIAISHQNVLRLMWLIGTSKNRSQMIRYTLANMKGI